MIIQTKYHGEVTIKEEQIITFSSGIPGFLDQKQFVILPLSEESPFLVLQSLQNADLGFIVSSPFLFFDQYEFDLEDTVVEILGIEDTEDVEVMVILTMESSIEKTTANLRAPIVVNKKNMTAKQVILHDTSYHTKHLLGVVSSC
ncbi:flagellar assembly protein FliW [Bacillus sp. NPDC077027]|uniref:flagellar assembly protein FliW n=1 Tax=Bacillus sp. NPDC077027 TaxID=3390548 RepID=UPI003D024574